MASSDKKPGVGRGRKRSPVDNPHKPFVCTLCDRRFNRNEHLKRHIQSLHSHEKPFECHDCGKKFSRSDNLDQHRRTHGASNIIEPKEAQDTSKFESSGDSSNFIQHNRDQQYSQQNSLGSDVGELGATLYNTIAQVLEPDSKQ